MKNALMLTMFLVVLSGCSAAQIDMMDQSAGLGKVKFSESTFDGATIAELSPAPLSTPNNRFSVFGDVKMGALWSSADPDVVPLVLQFDSSSSSGNAYTGITGLDINIDGEISKHITDGQTKLSNDGYNTVSKTIYTESKNYVTIPMSLMKRMIDAESCKLRVYTSDGYEDSVFNEERTRNNNATAKLRIKKMLQEIEERGLI